jgi:hypothetical protein
MINSSTINAIAEIGVLNLRVEDLAMMVGLGWSAVESAADFVRTGVTGVFRFCSLRSIRSAMSLVEPDAALTAVGGMLCSICAAASDSRVALLSSDAFDDECNAFGSCLLVSL